MGLSWVRERVSGWRDREGLVWVGEEVGGDGILGRYEARAGII